MKLHQNRVDDPLGDLCDALLSAWPLQRWGDVTVLVAVSGGADSVALLRTLVACRQRQPREPNGRLLVAHFNHQLRGDRADADARFVAQLAESLGLPCHSGQPSQPAGSALSPTSTASPGEEQLRRQRYDFLLRTAHRTGARYVAVGHTRDDNVETVLHHLFRGTGPTGMAGMPRHRDLGTDVVLIRPLLAVARQQIRSALNALGQPWQEDATNADPRWKRNWIRGELLPQIEAAYPGATERVAQMAQSQRSLLHTLSCRSAQWSQRCLEPTDDGAGWWVRYEATDATVVIDALRHAWQQRSWPLGSMTAAHWRRLSQTLRDTTPVCFDLPGGIQVSRPGARWLLRVKDLSPLPLAGGSDAVAAGEGPVDGRTPPGSAGSTPSPGDGGAILPEGPEGE